jgi:hypothetical protein
MALKKIYMLATGCSEVRSINVTTSHDTSSSMATIDCVNTSLTLGDSISIEGGYEDDREVIFTGYVKQIDRKVPENVYSITCADAMTRAIDYFIASSNPMEPLKFRNISAENLISTLMSQAGLTNFYCPTPSNFTFGVQNEFEVNLVPVFEYCRAISDNLTWSIYAEPSGRIVFRNRKPYPMVDEYPENTQPGWSADPTPTLSFDDTVSIDMGVTTSEKNLRNRVVVYGNEGIYAEAKKEVAELPDNFYKTAVLGAPGLIDTTSLAQSIADYNLELFCRYTEQARVTMIGNPHYRCREVVTADADKLGLTGTWYIDMCEHNLSSAGYITSIGIRRMPKA